MQSTPGAAVAWLLIAGLPAMLASATGLAQAALPAAVATEVKALADLCREGGGQPSSDKAIERALAWNARSRKFDFAPLSTVRPIR
jgi:hypothetical protein